MTEQAQSPKGLIPRGLPRKAAVGGGCKACLAVLIPFILTSCASSLPHFSGSRNIPADFAGIVHAGGSRTQQEFTYLNYLGISWVLHTFYWNGIEPEPGEWNFLEYDTLVDEAAAVGIKVFGVLAYDHQRLHPDKKNHYYIPPEHLPEYLEFVRRTAEHFKGRIGAWCIWNEPNFLSWNGTNEEFIELSRRAADVVREADSEVMLLGGAFNRGVLGLPKKFIREFFESGAMDKADAVAFHPYELNPSRTAALYGQFKKTADAYGFGDKIWITEVGYPTGGWYPTKISEKKFPAYVVQTFTLLAAAGCEKLFWYQMFDPHTRSGKNSEDFFGLARSRQDYTSKGAEAFRLCAVYLSGMSLYTPEADTSTGPPKGTPTGSLPKSVRSFWFKSQDGGALVLWNEGLGSKQISLRLPGTGHVIHDLVSGNIRQIQPEIALKTEKTPIFITWQNGDT